jgi:hypothetical protein
LYNSLLKKYLRIVFILQYFFFTGFLCVSIAQETDSVSLSTKKTNLLKGVNRIVDSLNLVTSDDSLQILDTVAVEDTLLQISKDAITSPVDYYAEDSIQFDIKNKKSYLHHLVKVNYEDIQLTSNYMEIDFDNNELFAKGIADSSGQLAGNPVFKQNQTEFKSREMRYNFNSKKGLVSQVITQESDGFLHGEMVKKMNDSVNFVYRGSFTTCNLSHPHYGFTFKKAKVIANDKIVTGPIQLHIADVPTPLAAPFSLIPNQKGHRNGILIPSYGESAELGFYFKGIGFYAAFYDMFDIAITGDIYTRGSFTLNAKSNYIKRYKFSGYVDAAYSLTRSGEQTTPSYRISNDFKLTWRHTQDPKAHPRNRFSADVNFLTSSFNQRNIVDVDQYVNTNFTSAISFSTSWASNFSLGVNADLSQNVQTKLMQLNLPNINFNISQFYPLRRREVVGKLRWYENISMSYNLIMTNRMHLYDTLPLEKQIPANMNFGMSHAIPISSTIKVLKYLDWNNTINLNEYWQFRGAYQSWGQDTNGNVKIQKDTVYGFWAIHDFGYTSTLRTTLYGMYSLKKGKVKAFRHEMIPALSFAYRPNINRDHFESYYDSIMQKEIVYSPTEGFLYGRPLDKQSAIMTFSLSNKLEMKVSNKKDSLGKTKKVTLIENVTISSSYNFTADDSIIFRWQPLAINGRTTILKALYLNFSAGLDPYIIGSQGRKVDTFEINVNKKLFRLSNTSWSVSLDYSLNDQTFKNKKSNEEENNTSFSSLGKWNISFRYSFSYNLSDNMRYYNVSIRDTNKYNKRITNTLNINGNIHLTQKWRLGFTTGYDFTNKMISVSSFDIYRDLHCWEMSFKWRPFGSYRGFEFAINVKSGMLKDLKYNVDKDYRDY